MASNFIFRPCFRPFFFQNVVKYCTVPKETTQSIDFSPEDDEFKKLELYKKVDRRRIIRKAPIKMEVGIPRTTKMPIDQDWPSVWPAARSFHPASIPLPVRQGHTKKLKAPAPSKWANAELMKIPNFFHLTPPAIKRHCEALKKFCTPWPKQLNSDSKCTKHFPIQITTHDFCQSGNSIRNPMTRVVTLELKLSSLELDYHARDKMLRLVKDRYDKKTDILTLVADRCPLKKQNYDYLMYLMTVLFYESWKVEPWESEKTEDDMERYIWQGSKSQKAVINILQRIKSQNNESNIEIPAPEDMQTTDIPKFKELLDIPEVQKYEKALTALRNEGESDYTLNAYKKAVKDLLGVIDSPSQNEVATN